MPYYYIIYIIEELKIYLAELGGGAKVANFPGCHIVFDEKLGGIAI